MEELTKLRTETTKTFSLQGGGKRLEARIGPVHYRDNYADKKEPWKDIDLAWDGKRLDKAPYILECKGVKYTITDKKTGLVSMIELLDSTVEAPLEIVPEHNRVSFRHTVSEDKVPFQARFKVSGKVKFLAKAFDDEGRLPVEAALKDGVLTEKLSSVVDGFTGEERPAKGKIRIDPTWQVSAAVDDVYRRLTPSYFALTGVGVLRAGAYDAANYQYGCGMRFQNIDIPAGSIVTSAYLTFKASTSYSSATVNTRISAEDVDDAAAFANDAAAFDARWAARTTARVDWDNIAAWVIDTNYNSPDISAPLQEVFSRPGWASGNDVVVFWDDFEDRSTHAGVAWREAYGYEGSSTYAPKLVIEYTEAGTYCRIAFASAAFAASPVWADVSDDLVAIHILRGRQNQLNRIEAGTATVLLKNFNGNYWPYNTAGDYYPNVSIGNRIQIYKAYSSSVYYLFTGFIRNYTPTWFVEGGLLSPGMQLECVDLQRNLSLAMLNDGTGYTQELSGTRVGNVLTDVGWLGGTDIEAGKEYVIASGALENVSAMDHLFAVQDAELGLLFIAGNGDVVFQERGARSVSPYDTSQATFGNGNLPIHNPELPLDDDLLYNEIRLTRSGGTEQTYSDSASILLHGLRTLSKSGLLLTSDTMAFIYCLYLLARYHSAKMRVKSFTILPQTPGYEADLWAAALGFDISTRITLVLTDADINGEYFIEGIEHNWDYREQIWTTKFQCSDASQYYYEPDAYDETFRPSGAGTNTNLTASAGSNYQCVDEATPNDDTDYVWQKATPAAYKVDTYAIPDLPVPDATINSVTVYIRVKCEINSTAQARAKEAVKVGATVYYGNDAAITTSYVTRSYTWTNSPLTGNPWTVAEVNALEIGVALQAGVSGGVTDAYARCTQVYAVINLTPLWSS